VTIGFDENLRYVFLRNLETELKSGARDPVDALSDSLDVCDSPVSLNRVSELALCYLPLNQRHLVVERSSRPFLKIEHVSLFSGVSSMGSCVDLLVSLLNNRIAIDPVLAAHIAGGDALDTLWPLLAASGYPFNHQWTRFWSAEQMTLALSIYADNPSLLHVLASNTSGGWTPRIFEAPRVHASKIVWHVERALRACSLAAPHLLEHVTHTVNPAILPELISSGSVPDASLRDLVKSFNSSSLLELLEGGSAYAVACVLAEVRGFTELTSIVSTDECMIVISNACGVPPDRETAHLAAALEPKLSVKERFQAASVLVGSK
jgi:hypothetical protein